MKELRVSLAMVVILFLCIGIIMIYSASGIYAQQELKNSTYFLTRHLLFVLMGVIATIPVMLIDYRELRKYAKPMMLISIVLLVLVLIPHLGKSSFGARRWFKIGPINFQPSELAKLTMLIYVADFLARKKNEIRSLSRGFFPLMMVMGITCLLILKEPDMGNAVLIGLMVWVLMFIGGAKLSHVMSIAIMALGAIIVLIKFEPYRMRRMVAFLDPWKDSLGAGFQLTQSHIAFGSGGIFGLGLGKSVQKLFYLPAAHTDFIMSIIGEELGLLGAFTVIMLFIIFVWQGARIAKRTQDPFGYYLASGIVAMLGTQAMVNVGVSMGALPTKGLPLPFISYGGSALIFNMVAVGLLLNISRTEDL
ncbi:MAG: putative lipid II flippase FtsW [Candidatus Omnitrophica bacterium]|nr:putative lipid II flippase FtsW [Candidatus Omnitrophota bacterium]